MGVVDRTLRKRWPWLVAAALVIALYVSSLVRLRMADGDSRPVGGAAEIEALAQREDINLMFVLVDTVRADRLSAYGYERDTTPFLSKLASQGIRFERNLSQSSWTKCSMASLWTGLYPSRTGVTRFEHVLSPEARMPAEILSEAGIRTVGIWRNGWVEGYFGFDQGFDVYTRPVSRRPSAAVIRENPTMKEVGTDMDAVDAAEEFLRIYGSDRWFLYLHLMDVHEYLYDEESALFGTAYTDVYDNAIRRADWVLSQLYDLLARQGRLENTIFVVSSDHGEAFNERGYEGHARYVYRETTEVPWVISLPFRLDPGISIRQRTANVDVWPTLLEILGLPSMGEGLDGRSQRDAILRAARGEPEAGDASPRYAHLDQSWGKQGWAPNPTVAVVQDDFRYVRVNEGSELQEHLFQAGQGTGRELDDLGESEPERLAHMRGLAEDYLAKRPPWTAETPALEMDEIQLNQLRALGYAVP